jgi:Flp pilus assembly protein TadG
MKTRLQQSGTYTIAWILLLPVMLGFGVLAVDLNQYYLALAELQAAADATVLHAAPELYIHDSENGDGSITNCSRSNTYNGCLNLYGYTNLDNDSVRSWAAILMTTFPNYQVRGQAVQSLSLNPNTMRGNFSFTQQRFNDVTPAGAYSYKNPGTGLFAQQYLESANTLNSDKMINATTITLQTPTPLRSFFGGFVGLNNPFGSPQAEATAYIGFTGETTITTPLAICDRALQDSAGDYRDQALDLWRDNDYQLRWTSLGSGTATSGVVLSQIQAMPQCQSGTGSAGELIRVGQHLGTQEIVSNPSSNWQQVFDAFYQCWRQDEAVYSESSEKALGPDQPWRLVVPVLACDHNHEVLGFTKLNILWLIPSISTATANSSEPCSATDRIDTLTGCAPPLGGAGDITPYIPLRMNAFARFDNDWLNHANDISNSAANNRTDDQDTLTDWNEFVNSSYFNIQRHGNLATCIDASDANNCIPLLENRIYVAPEVNFVATGRPGGRYNFGAFAARPVLVE